MWEQGAMGKTEIVPNRLWRWWVVLLDRWGRTRLIVRLGARIMGLTPLDLGVAPWTICPVCGPMRCRHHRLQWKSWETNESVDSNLAIGVTYAEL